MKPVNRYTSNEFHDWVRASPCVPPVILQDLDAWAICASSLDHKPRALIELKRSFIAVEEWRPFAADRNNYASLLALADAAGIPFWVVYFRKDRPVLDSTPLHCFHMTQAIPEYRYGHSVLPAGEFAGRLADEMRQAA